MNCLGPTLFRFAAAASLLCSFWSVGSPQRNNPYSSNPASRGGSRGSTVATIQPVIIEIGGPRSTKPLQPHDPAGKTLDPSVPLTEVYRIGIGDVLFINLKNAPNAWGYYTVRRDGTIDFPLTRDSLTAALKTTDQLEAEIAALITLYSNPEVEVKVREYASHKINVTGMAERVGERSLRREAMPLFAIRAEALVNSAATRVNIRRNDLSNVESYDLRDERTNDILIYPGNAVEFVTDGQRSMIASTGYFYIAGEVNSPGQKPFTGGITLMQAVMASGGAKGNPKRVTLRRKSDKGLLHIVEYDLRAIRSGKASDPGLQPGDMIEISN